MDIFGLTINLFHSLKWWLAPPESLRTNDTLCFISSTVKSKAKFENIRLTLLSEIQFTPLVLWCLNNNLINSSNIPANHLVFKRVIDCFVAFVVTLRRFSRRFNTSMKFNSLQF